MQKSFKLISKLLCVVGLSLCAVSIFGITTSCSKKSGGDIYSGTLKFNSSNWQDKIAELGVTPLESQTSTFEDIVENMKQNPASFLYTFPQGWTHDFFSNHAVNTDFIFNENADGKFSFVIKFVMDQPTTWQNSSYNTHFGSLADNVASDFTSGEIKVDGSTPEIASAGPGYDQLRFIDASSITTSFWDAANQPISCTQTNKTTIVRCGNEYFKNVSFIVD